jgi:hypothetical protein
MRDNNSKKKKKRKQNQELKAKNEKLERKENLEKE